MSRLFDKISEVGLYNTVKGTLKREYYKILQRIHGFDSWHVSPYELRGYAHTVAKYVSNKDCGNNLIVDLGCGMGEIISNIRHSNRVGYDPDQKIISLAPVVHKWGSGKGVIFRHGSFDQLCDDYEKGTTVEYLITLAFMQGSTEDHWVDAYHKVAEELDVKHFLIDTHKEGFNGAHRLDFSKIIPKNYVLEERLGPFLSERFIEIYTKQ